MARSRKRARRLTDAYAFPGFRPQTLVRGIFGDPKARIVALVRRSKKRCVVFAGESIAAGTIGAPAWFATCRRAIHACTWSWRSGAWTAGNAAA
jgi:hypothetical protein